MPESDTREGRIAIVMRELAELEAADAAAELNPRRKRSGIGPSIVFSVRLDTQELTALENRAALIGLKPSVLARNLIRSGLASRHGESVARALDEVDHALSELRSVLG